MKEIKKNDVVYLTEYDVHVNPYLTYSQIQQIVDSADKTSMWSERQQTIDMLVLLHATDIGLEKIQEIGHDTFLASGLIKAVKESIVNYEDIFDGIKYNESIVRVLSRLGKELPAYMRKAEEMEKNGEKRGK